MNDISSDDIFLQGVDQRFLFGQALAQAALTYRYGDEHQPVTTADILTPRRKMCIRDRYQQISLRVHSYKKHTEEVR